MEAGTGGLTIGELAARAGLPVATLRTWEARHGFPSPTRTPSGHRRYTERDADLVAQVLARRSSGLSLDVAIERARHRARQPEPSLFAALRNARPGLVAHQLSKRAMVAVSRAVEDECLARAEPGAVIGSFQDERFYRQSERRWRELARGAEVAAVFADFPARRGARVPAEVPLPDTSPLRREWAIVHAAPSFTACLVGWDLPDQTSRPDRLRTFETAWTSEPTVVLHVITAAADLAAPNAAEVSDRLHRWIDDASPPVAGAGHHAEALANRIVAYLAATGAAG